MLLNLSRVLLAFSFVVAFSATPVAAQSDTTNTDKFDVDFLFSYYDQDGDHSAVTGGTGSEDLQVFSPVIILGWRVNDDWTISADLGIDQISSASIGNIQIGVSGGSIPASDTRTFGTVKALRTFGTQVVGMQIGAANEFDYGSISFGLDYSIDLFKGNTTLSGSARHYDDTVDLYDIDGFNQGQADRTTTDGFITWSQVLGRRTAGSVELFYSAQSGFLSTPFHEVILINGDRTTERLPDRRDRFAVGLRLNHAFSPSIVQRVGYRYYDDDWVIAAHSIELETHVRLSGPREMWIFPILRYHTQTGADYFGETGTFTGDEPYLTSDWDLAEIATTKIGAGWSVTALPGEEWMLDLNRFEVRGTYYDRDDGLQGFTVSFAFGWTF